MENVKEGETKSELRSDREHGEDRGRGIEALNTMETKSEQKFPQLMSASKAFEVILNEVGDYNYYQWKLLFLIGIGGFFTGFHNLGAVFLAATPDHWCNIPYFKERNLTLDRSSLNVTVPWIRGKKGSLEPSKCTYYDHEYSSILTQDYLTVNISSVHLSTIDDLPSPNVTSCDSWIYDDGIFTSTIVTQWDLVCDKRWVMSSTQASYMMGILTGAVIFSAISDKMGRRVSSLICCSLFILASISTSFSTSLVMFLVLRFIVAASGQGMALVNFTLLMESVSSKGRNVIGNSYHIFFAIGVSFLGLIAYLVTDWRNLQLACSVPILVLVGYFWLLPESPRWLLMQRREKEALEILKSIAEANGKKLPSDEELKPLLSIIADEIQSQPTTTIREKIKSVLNIVVTLVRTPNMRRRNVIVFYAWFVTSMIYYGLTFSGSNINASLYIIVMISGLIELPSIAVVILMLLRFERRTVLSLSFILGGAACIAIIFVPTEMVGWNLALAMFGKFTISGSFPLAFMLSVELVPTDVRNISIGMASMFARIGSGIAPYIVDLLGDVYYAIPSTIFGVLSLLAGLLSLLLPETGNKRLPESIQEIEAMPR